MVGFLGFLAEGRMFLSNSFLGSPIVGKQALCAWREAGPRPSLPPAALREACPTSTLDLRPEGKALTRLREHEVGDFCSKMITSYKHMQLVPHESRLAVP